MSECRNIVSVAAQSYIGIVLFGKGESVIIVSDDDVVLLLLVLTKVKEEKL